MARPRKTIEVQDIRVKINDMLKLDLDRVTTEAKAALTILLEDILMETGNYKGFNFNMPLEQARAVSPGDAAYFDRYYH